jgi:hypothetical protein
MEWKALLLKFWWDLEASGVDVLPFFLVVASELFRKLSLSQPASSVSGNQGGGGD